MAPQPETVFDRYAASLQKVFDGFKGCYCCPLTLAIVPRERIDVLSLEHCVPDGLGTTPFVLTLKQANNLAGSKIDFHLHRYLRHKEFFQDGIGRYEVRLLFGEQSLGATYTRRVGPSGTASDFQVVAGVTNPAYLTEGALLAASGHAEFQIAFGQRDLYTTTLMRLAVLKAGYLCAFAELGYTFILAPCFNSVRTQIARPEESLLPLDRLVQPIEKQHVLPGIYFIVEPQELFAAFLDLELTKNNGATPSCFRVFLPCRSDSAAYWPELKQARLRCVRVPPGDYIAHPRAWFEYAPVVSTPPPDPAAPSA